MTACVTNQYAVCITRAGMDTFATCAHVRSYVQHACPHDTLTSQPRRSRRRACQEIINKHAYQQTTHRDEPDGRRALSSRPNTGPTRTHDTPR